MTLRVLQPRSIIHVLTTNLPWAESEKHIIWAVKLAYQPHQVAVAVQQNSLMGLTNKDLSWAIWNMFLTDFGWPGRSERTELWLMTFQWTPECHATCVSELSLESYQYSNPFWGISIKHFLDSKFLPCIYSCQTGPSGSEVFRLSCLEEIISSHAPL